MDALSISFDPLAPVWMIAVAAIAALTAGVFAVRRRAWLRALAVAAFALALMNPALVQEEREALSDAVVLVVDDSESMTLGARAPAAEAAAAAVRAAVEADPTLELVEVRAPRGDDGTRLFDAVTAGLGEAARDRVAGVIAVTDGQAHDVPDAPAAALGDLNAPIHAIIVGARNARDRRLEVLRAPQFGLVGEAVAFQLRVEDSGGAAGERVGVTLSVDGDDPIRETLPVGETVEVRLELQRRGANVVEITVDEAPGELTLVNNRTAVSVAGVRDRLRVLLVTGEPHAGARAWRDLLKSDPSVDLVHFTILRPPEKQDGTPIGELSLIAFPVRELFEEKLESFDLVIFDRYRRRDVIRALYLDNVARYVDNGGALLVAAGPPFASPYSLYRTPLSAVLPARPALDRVIEDGFRPRVTEVGRAHPVTAGFAVGDEDPEWGRWYRMIEASPIKGDTVLEGPNGRPLLMLDRVGQGRVAMLLSDQSWLWARGVDGGGPHAELFRRLAHWLMGEPELEEERLDADTRDGDLVISRRTMGPAPEPARIVTPSGAERDAAFTEVEPGLYTARAAAGETGLHRVRSGDLTAAVGVGPLNPREFADVRPTSAVVTPLLDATGGGAAFIGAGARPALPDLRRTRADADQSGRGWLGLQRNNAYAVTASASRPLAPALAAVALLLVLTTLAWAREGR